MSCLIINRKKTHPLGFVSWYFYRPLGADGKKRFLYVLHFSPEQIDQGRAYLARALRRARHQMQVSINEMKWKS